MENITIRKWIEKFDNGEFTGESISRYDIETQCKAGWFDWFCRDTSLKNKTKKIGNIIKDIKNDYILDHFYTWFQNNDAFEYPLYDDIRFEPLDQSKREQQYFGIQCGHPFGSEYMYEVFTARNDYKTEFKCKNKKEVLAIIEQLAKEFNN